MAEIEIERRRRRSAWTWVALLLVLVAVAIGAWLVLGNGVEGGDAPPAAEINIEQPAEPLSEPMEPLRAPEDGAPMDTDPEATTVPDDAGAATQSGTDPVR